MESIQEAARHLALVTSTNHAPGSIRPRLDEELSTAPLFSSLARQIIESKHQKDDASNDQSTRRPAIYPHYGLLGLRMAPIPNGTNSNNLVYTNISAPWSAFICGSQGSGKSHTLSCLLENALIAPSPVGSLSSPLAGMVLHYDKFTAFSSTQFCEAAYLCSSGIPVRVMVSPTNYYAMKAAYENLPGLRGGLIQVVPMYLSQKHLNIGMMKTLMGVGNAENRPLYIEVVIKVLREMATKCQGQSGFDYNAFKQRLEVESFLGGQNLPLKMRLEVLESFFEPGTVAGKKSKGSPKPVSDMWSFPKGTLTIVDLSCPFVGPDEACVLFNICVSLFLKDRADTGRIIALDEAHKFLSTTSTEAVEMTDTLLSVIRQQRHLSARVLIATQEPTTSPALLDLCNVSIIHRFTSPSWYSAIENHIAGAATEKRRGLGSDLFNSIVRLATGEALVFCPTALIDHTLVDLTTDDDVEEDAGEDEQRYDCSGRVTCEEDAYSEYTGEADTPSEEDPDSHTVTELGSGHLRLRIRNRITADGGKSQMQ